MAQSPSQFDSIRIARATRSEARIAAAASVRAGGRARGIQPKISNTSATTVGHTLYVPPTPGTTPTPTEILPTPTPTEITPTPTEILPTPTPTEITPTPTPTPTPGDSCQLFNIAGDNGLVNIAGDQNIDLINC